MVQFGSHTKSEPGPVATGSRYDPRFLRKGIMNKKFYIVIVR